MKLVLRFDVQCDWFCFSSESDIMIKSPDIIKLVLLRYRQRAGFIKLFSLAPRTLSLVQVSQHWSGSSAWLELVSIDIEAGLMNLFPNMT
jgi:hypothetical protein